MKFYKSLSAILLFIVVCGCNSLNTKRQLAINIEDNRNFQTVDSMGKALLSKGFNAGSGYSQVWIRDLNTFIETACSVVDHQSLKEAILVFFSLQQSNGEIVDGYVLKDKFNWEDPNQYFSNAAPNHVGFKNTVETDQETSLIQTVAKYIRITKDKSILAEVIDGKTVYSRILLAIDYLMKEKFNPQYRLITGALTVDWGDVQANNENPVDINKESDITIDIYDNAMLIIALNDLVEISSDSLPTKYHKNLASKISINSRKYLWDNNKQKFIPHIYIGKSSIPRGFDESKIHYHGGTAVAIEAGLLSKEEIKTVYLQMVENVKLSGMRSIGITNFPLYPDGFFRGGMAKPYIYQNGGDWTWFGARMVQQLIANGYVKEAYDAIDPMITRVIKDHGFYEWYGQGETPSGSNDFKGAAGVLCKSIEMFRNWSKENK